MTRPEGTILRTAFGGAVRYLAPELIKDSNVLATADSDTFSFGMLMLECTHREDVETPSESPFRVVVVLVYSSSWGWVRVAVDKPSDEPLRKGETHSTKLSASSLNFRTYAFPHYRYEMKTSLF